ncbi:1-deoxy-D-xylulose-5-phosphate synthase [Streptomyces acidiscabies]|uniref:1-deoxy-D-xylulose-5-phosphate synthase n=1 Tax=Streptomyces acidiscabies TaxID=42234 RepID=UPI00095EAEA1|nr:1-deoxy-D-xylulose-5-phosphate synthase [Streptomyces acidiscabies]GAV41734.1 1-deoxy-D-xylulose-5-phosphate synthase [Streptomyces acidiscabies]
MIARQEAVSSNRGALDRGLPDELGSPAGIKALRPEQLAEVSDRIREFLIEAVSRTGGHLGSNLGAVELTLALHRVFDSPRDVMLWDTGHQAYVHKLVTGRIMDFRTLRQAGGLSGYPSRAESEHDWIENSHASTSLSYAHGLSEGFAARGEDRRVIAVIGDGSLTGGMAYEGLNNLGRSGRHVLIVLNDNGRSYAPTASRLPGQLRRDPALKLWEESQRRRLERALDAAADISRQAAKDLWAIHRALGDRPRPEAFFHALGIHYTGPVDGHDTPAVEAALRSADAVPGPVVVHVVTQKGKGYSFAEDDLEKCLHDVPVFDTATGPVAPVPGPSGLTRAFSDTLMECAAADERVHAITAAMPGPTGLLPFHQRHPERFHDVGIAEQHAVTLAAGLAMAGRRPVVAVYSTFLARAFDQVNLDVGLHGLPVVFALDRAGITGDDGPSHHGVLDLALCLRVPGMTVLAPSSADELKVMLRHALTLPGPVAIRWPKGSPEQADAQTGEGLRGRRLRSAGERPEICLLAVGRMVAPAMCAAVELTAGGRGVTVWDVRCAKPLDERMLADAARHHTVLTVEDGYREGGVGAAVAAELGRTAQERGVRPPVTTVLGVPDMYVPQAKPDAILSRLGLDAAGIAASARDTWRRNRPGPARPFDAGRR